MNRGAVCSKKCSAREDSSSGLALKAWLSRQICKGRHEANRIGADYAFPSRAICPPLVDQESDGFFVN